MYEIESLARRGAKRNYARRSREPIHPYPPRRAGTRTAPARDGPFRGAIRKRLILSRVADAVGAPSRTEEAENGRKGSHGVGRNRQRNQ